MKKFALGAGAVLGIAAIASSLWYYRPWSDLSPADVARLKNLDERFVVFREMDKILPSRRIEGAAVEYEFPRDIKPLNVTYEWEGKTKTLEQFIQERSLTSLLVINDGTLVNENYYVGEEPETRHTSWSVAKSYVATLVAMAVADGKISSLDDSVETYAPEYKGTDYGKATIRHLLMMSSGIGFNEDYEAEGSDIRELFFNVFLFNADVDKMVRKYKQSYDAGTALDYISPNTHVLSAVVRDVYGKPLSEIADERIFKPLGMGYATWNQDRKGDVGKAIGYCCLNTRSIDYAKFGQLYLQNGVWKGKQILPVGWVDEVAKPHADFQDPKIASTYGDFGYSYHFWIPPNYDDEFYAAGYNGQIIWVDRKRKVVIVRTAADLEHQQHGLENAAVMRAIAKQVSGK